MNEADVYAFLKKIPLQPFLTKSPPEYFIILPIR